MKNIMVEANNNRVTVITVTYNSSTHIIKFLQSLTNASKYISKIVIIENASPDKNITRNIVTNFKSKSKLDIQIHVRKDNYGFAKSCNYGTLFADSNLFLFINPDTEINNNTIKTLINHLVSKNADIIGPKIISYDDRLHYGAVRYPTMLTGIFEFSNLGKLFNYYNPHKSFYYINSNKVTRGQDDVVVDVIGGACMLMKRSCFEQLGGFDETFFMYLEDVDLCLRAARVGMKIVYCPHAKILHEGGASSQNKYHTSINAWYKSRRLYFRKHFNYFENAIIQPIFIMDEIFTKCLKPITHSS